MVDFSPGEDVLALAAGLGGIVNANGALARLSIAGSAMRLDLGEGDAILLAGVAPGQITAADIVFY